MLPERDLESRYLALTRQATELLRERQEIGLRLGEIHRELAQTGAKLGWSAAEELAPAPEPEESVDRELAARLSRLQDQIEALREVLR